MANEHINEDSHKNAFINHITEFIGKLLEVKIEDGNSNDGMLLVAWWKSMFCRSTKKIFFYSYITYIVYIFWYHMSELIMYLSILFQVRESFLELTKMIFYSCN